MTLREALVAFHGRTRDAAANQLVRDTVRELVRRGVANESDRGDLESVILEMLLRKDYFSARPGTDAGARSYLRRMVASRRTDLYRSRQRRQVQAEADVEKLSHGRQEAETYLDLEQADDDLRRVLDLVRARAHQITAQRYQADLAARVENLFALSAGDVDIDALVVREIGEGASAEATRKAENRLYTNHKRAREALAKAVQSLSGEGVLTPDQAQVAMYCIQKLMLRCQKRGGRASTGEK